MAKFDVENLQKLESAVDGVEEIIKPMQSGIRNCEEICKETGSKNLETTAANAVAGVDALCKSLTELVETFRTVIAKQRKLASALGE